MNETTLQPGDFEALQEMKPGRWYYTVGECHRECMDRLQASGLVESGPNPAGDWPAYRRIGLVSYP